MNLFRKNIFVITIHCIFIYLIFSLVFFYMPRNNVFLTTITDISNVLFDGKQLDKNGEIKGYFINGKPIDEVNQQGATYLSFENPPATSSDEALWGYLPIDTRLLIIVQEGDGGSSRLELIYTLKVEENYNNFLSGDLTINYYGTTNKETITKLYDQMKINVINKMLEQTPYGDGFYGIMDVNYVINGKTTTKHLVVVNQERITSLWVRK